MHEVVSWTDFFHVFTDSKVFHFFDSFHMNAKKLNLRCHSNSDIKVLTF